ncbi:MAG: hypothetical protein JNM59_12945 [Hyphomonadaceae bacterium]|nr:hypothetical protein [Hyphomonadaceae bacterium]
MIWLQWLGAALLALVVIYFIWKFYSTRADFTFMTHNDQGFKRALKGRGFIIDPEEFIVKGATAPTLEFVALDPATGNRKMVPLLNQRSGAVNLRPQYCVPLPFTAITADNHTLVVEARVQFSINRNKMFFVYHVQDFGLALETRLQSAVRAEVGKRQDQELRANLHEVEEQAIKRLRQAEEDGDEAHEAGIALGVNFHTMSFTYTAADEFAAQGGVATGLGAVSASGEQGAHSAGQAPAAGRALTRAGALSLRPQQLDQFADVFRHQTPESTAAMLAVLEMQTRQNIAEALAASGQLIVVTPQELGLAGATVQGQILARVTGQGAGGPG